MLEAFLCLLHGGLPAALLAAMTDHRLRLLHLSDLHERGPREREPWRRRRVLGDAWKRNLDELLADAAAIDLVVFTGDVADWGLPVEYEGAADFVEALLERLAVPKERFFVVPGNHDIQRKVQEPLWKQLRSILLSTDPLEISRWLAGGPPPRGVDAENRDLLLARSAAYRAWLDALGLVDCLPETSPHGRLGYRAVPLLPALPFDVHVIGLDSAWLCGGDDDSGRLLLTEDQIARLATDRGESLPGFRLALVHHPLTDLADARPSRDLLAQHVDLLLRGHLHEEDLLTTSTPDQTLREIAAGCVYEGDRGNRWRNACHLIDITLDPAGRPTRYDVRLRGFANRGTGFWFDDGSLFRGAPQGRVTWRLTAPSIAPPSRRGDGIFVGRHDELRELAGALLPAGGAPRPVAIGALQGMPGVGKSYLADRFAAEQGPRFPGGTFRLSLDPDDLAAADVAAAARPADLTAARSVPPLTATLLGRLADVLRVPLHTPDAAERFGDRLRDALLHVENVDTQAAAEAVVALAAVLRGCPLIVTGRYQGLGHTDADWKCIQVAPFDEPTALAQLSAELGPARVAAECVAFRRLSALLGYLPLALHLAAGHLRDGGYAVDTFHERLLEIDLDLDPDDPADRLLRDDPVRANLRRTFTLSLTHLRRDLARRRLDPDVLLPAFAALAHAPPAGFGRSLGAALAGLDLARFDPLIAAARKLSLLARVPEQDRPDGAWRIHPLLAQHLRRDPAAAAGPTRMTAWFLERLPTLPAGQEELQGQRWKEVTQEAAALVSWLAQVGGGDLVRVERAGSVFAQHNGPFQAWLDLCERGLEVRAEPAERSNFLFTLMHVAQNMGALDRSLAAAQDKETVDRDRGAEREAALAAGCRADILQARGELDEALRIRQEEELPVYAKLGDVRERAVTMGRVADILQARGELDEALRIRQEEQLPVYAKLGDVRERAVTMHWIAHIYRAQGEMNQAVQILEKDALPIYARLGAHDLLRGRQYLADLLLSRGEPGDREAAADLLRLAHEAAAALRLPEAKQILGLQQRYGLLPGPRSGSGDPER